jgi:hypothetical protein
MNSRVAIITFLDTGAGPDQGLPGQSPGIWPSPGYPTHPIAPGGGPSTGPGFPTHPIAPGGPPVGIWPSPGYPTHPIAPGGPPPGVWPSPPVGVWPNPPGGGNYPSHQPVFPFPPVGPDNTLPPEETPPGTPVQLPVFPPHVSPVPPREDQKFELKFSPLYGWVLVPVKDETAEPK